LRQNIIERRPHLPNESESQSAVRTFRRRTWKRRRLTIVKLLSCYG